MSNKEKSIFENNFKVYEDKDIIELESWTDGGVDMIITLDKTSTKTLTEQFNEYIDNFDIDEEIDLMRTDIRYRERFTIRESLNDYDNWLDWCNKITKELNADIQKEQTI